MPCTVYDFFSKIVFCDIGLPLLVVILWAIFTHNRAAANRLPVIAAQNITQVQQQVQQQLQQQLQQQVRQVQQQLQQQVHHPGTAAGMAGTAAPTAATAAGTAGTEAGTAGQQFSAGTVEQKSNI